MTRLMQDLDHQAARADGAERELTEAREARTTAEKTATDASQERDLAGISLETTRAELAERTEALEAERSSSQATIAELTAQLSTTTRAAESATERAVDLEARLEAANRARDDAYSRADEMNEQLDRARSDAEQLRTQAASIGDELAATHAALDQAQARADDALTREEQANAKAGEAEQAASDAQRAADAARAEVARVEAWRPPAPVEEPVALVETPEVVEPSEGPLPFDAALASAFGQDLADIASAEAPAVADDESPDPPHFVPPPESPAKRARAKMPAFQVVEDSTPTVKSGGPIVDLEASLVRRNEPAAQPTANGGDAEAGEDAEGSDEAPKERKPEPAWRRTAMAELTALATDSDDLTPRRRR
jgi:hypothetical protein